MSREALEPDDEEERMPCGPGCTGHLGDSDHPLSDAYRHIPSDRPASREALEQLLAPALRESRILSGGYCQKEADISVPARCCSYHEGFEDALDVAVQKLVGDRPALEAKVAEALLNHGEDGMNGNHAQHKYHYACILCRQNVPEIARIALDAIFGEGEE